MIEIMVKGSNKYKTPRMKKDVMLRQATLPTRLNCDQELFAEISELLQVWSEGLWSSRIIHLS